MPTVLLATDGSDLATNALARGLQVVDTSGRIVVMTVIPALDPSLVTGAGHTGPVMRIDEQERMLEAQDAEGRSILSDAASLVTSGEVETLLRRGDAWHEICAVADELAADVIVIGTRGHGGLRRAVLGSVSDHVVRHAPCPVLTVAGH